MSDSTPSVSVEPRRRACEAEQEDDRLDEVGRVTWHSSSEDEGPDVGISVGLGDGKHLWLGEITDSRHEEEGDAVADLGGPMGWWIILYNDKAPCGEQSTVIGKMTDEVDHTGFANALAASLREAAAPERAAREAAEAERDKLLPYRDELLKIADDLGEASDPFAAWESVAALKAQRGELLKALADLTDAFLSRHGCFPIDQTNDEQRHWHRAMSRAYELVGQPDTPAREAAIRNAEAKTAASGAGWRPIGTAPKDGKPLDLWVRPHDAFENGNAGRVPDALWLDGEWKRFSWVLDRWHPVADAGVPTHWKRDTPPAAAVSDAKGAE